MAERVVQELTPLEKARAEAAAELAKPATDLRRDADMPRNGAAPDSGDGAKPNPAVDHKPTTVLRISPSDPYYGMEAAQMLISACNRNNWGLIPGTHNSERLAMAVLTEVARNGRMDQLRSGIIAQFAGKDSNMTLERYVKEEFDGRDKAQALALVSGKFQATEVRQLVEALDHGKFDVAMGTLMLARERGSLGQVLAPISISEITGKKDDKAYQLFDRAYKDGKISGQEKDQLVNYIWGKDPERRAQALIEACADASNVELSGGARKKAVERFKYNLADLTQGEREAVDAELGKRKFSIQGLLDGLDDKGLLLAAERRTVETPAATAAVPATKPAEHKPTQRSETRGGVEERMDEHTAQGATIKIEKGMTLSKLAKEHGVSVAQLLEANPNIKDANKIYAGRSLVIPGAAVAAK